MELEFVQTTRNGDRNRVWRTRPTTGAHDRPSDAVLFAGSFMTPSIAALMGRWFWWPVRVRQRPAPQKFGDEDTRQLSLF